jgi:hypothetical protein
MWSQFVVERYAREKHQAHLREAAHDRLPGGRRQAAHPAPGRPMRVHAALVLAAMVVVMAVAAGTRLVLLG